MTRREFVRSALFTAVAIPLGVDAARLKRPLKVAVITDIHHGLAPDAQFRLEMFVEEVLKRKDLDFVLQMGDFCYSQPDSKEFLNLWNRIKLPKLHVLGNHDMDKCDKDAAVKLWGMRSRYYAEDRGDYRFVVLDLNHFKKEGKLHAYANGNYFTDNATHNWADPEQLAWLEHELLTSTKPFVLISHQPLGFAEAGAPLPHEQAQVLDIVTRARDRNPKGAVVICLCGHMHVDRLEHHQGIPCYCVNSASYFWYGGMNAYSDPLYAFFEFTTDGRLLVEGRGGEFVKPPPPASSSVTGRSASIGSRELKLDRIDAKRL